jgi:dCTP diphosphatase
MDKTLERIVAFVQERDWEQFQTPKDMAISLSLEASEVLEHFQWMTLEESRVYVESAKGKAGLSAELADVLYWVLLMSHYFKVDLQEALESKMLHNEQKYPISKVIGRHNNKYARE